MFEEPLILDYNYFGLLHHNLLPTLMLTGQVDTLSRSSTEVEYRGVVNAIPETSWIRNLLRELHTPLFTATLVQVNAGLQEFVGLPDVLTILMITFVIDLL
nr:ribonuclease H-like domain-containing protein [Tanacetum cinerariifolium]